MSKRLFLSFFFLLILCAPAWAQGLRTSVCVVYPECSPEDSLLLADYAQQFARIGFIADASSMRAAAGHSFGSGVLTERYVLTNRHVVGYAKTVKLVFMLHDRTLTFEHCPVVSSDSVADIAAVALPSDLSALHPLALNDEPVSDGDEIFAAGFPGLNGEPSWQLTKGVVSNAKLHVEGNDYIQHTAAIDPGSSGGPLLRKRDGRYQLIGLNTMKAFLRDRVGMSVAMADIARFMASAPNTTDQHTLERLRAADSKLLTDYYRILPDSMKTVLHDIDVRLPLDRVMAIADFYGGVEQMQKKSEEKGGRQTKNVDKRLTQNKAGVDHLRDEWSIFLSHDAWRLNKYAAVPGWIQMPSLNMEIAHGYLIYGFVLSVPMRPEEHFGYIDGRDTIAPYTYQDVGVTAGVRFGTHVPVRLNNRHVIVPRLTVDGIGGKMIRADEMAIMLPIRAGLEYRYQMKSSSLFLGAGYSMLVRFHFKTKIYPEQGFHLRAGVAF